MKKKSGIICTACSGEFPHPKTRQCQGCGAYLCDPDWDAHTREQCAELRRIFEDYSPTGRTRS